MTLDFLKLKSKLPYIIVFIFALISFFWFQKYKEARKQLRDPQRVQQAQIRAIVEKVGKLIDLPADEEPTLATVTDLDKLSDQPFFANAQLGDKVLIYIKNQKAILYRPSENKIINLSTIETEGKAAGTSTKRPAAKEEAEYVQIAVYYVKKDDAKLKALQDKLKTILPTSSIVTREKAGNTDYSSILVVDLDDSRREVTEKIATAIKAKVGFLPLGEVRPAAHILIIIP